MGQVLWNFFSDFLTFFWHPQVDLFNWPLCRLHHHKNPKSKKKKNWEKKISKKISLTYEFGLAGINKVLAIIIWKISSLKFGQVWCKRQKKIFSNNYCDLLLHASFTKFTGPAKLFLNNNIIYFLKKIVTFWILWWWSLQRGQLNK